MSYEQDIKKLDQQLHFIDEAYKMLASRVRGYRRLYNEASNDIPNLDIDTHENLYYHSVNVDEWEAVLVHKDKSL